MRVAFLATLKAPDHPTPSGDRLIARLLMQALGEAGCDVRLASSHSTRTRTSDVAALEVAKADAERVARSLVEMYEAPTDGWRPDLWFTYHLYYKAPDWIGATVAAALAIPYVAAEATYAGKRDRDGWAPWQREAVAHISIADRLLCFSAGDREGLARIVPTARLVDLPPFIDVQGFPAPGPDCADPPSSPRPSSMATEPIPGIRQAPSPPLRLVTIAMMRDGAKLESYRDLARALAHLPPGSWHLTIVGDGPRRDAVGALFAGFPTHSLTWAGLASESEVRRHLTAADVFVWPGVGEALGMVYLEAQAAGCPVVAYRTDGTTSVVAEGRSGRLVAPGDVAALAAAMATLHADPALRVRMGSAARAFVHGERSVAHAAHILAETLGPLVAARRSDATRSPTP